MNMQYILDWAEKTKPFKIRINKQNKLKPININKNGLIVMKGLSEELDGKLLAIFRKEFEEKARIRHKYGDKEDFFFVIGYIKKNKDGIFEFPI